MHEHKTFEGRQNVDEEEILWRKIHRKQLVPDEETGRFRPMSGAFKDIRKELSVDVASKTTRKKALVEWAVGIAAFSASIPLKHGNRVIYDPMPDNPAHALVLGALSTQCIQEILDKYHWVIEPKNLL